MLLNLIESQVFQGLTGYCSCSFRGQNFYLKPWEQPEIVIINSPVSADVGDVDVGDVGDVGDVRVRDVEDVRDVRVRDVEDVEDVRDVRASDVEEDVRKWERTIEK